MAIKLLGPRKPTGKYKYILMVKKDGVVTEEITLHDPWDPIDMRYDVDTLTLEDSLLDNGWNPVSVDVYSRINDRYGHVVIRASARELPHIGPYTFEIREELNT